MTQETIQNDGERKPQRTKTNSQWTSLKTVSDYGCLHGTAEQEQSNQQRLNTYSGNTELNGNEEIFSINNYSSSYQGENHQIIFPLHAKLIVVLNNAVSGNKLHTYIHN